MKNKKPKQILVIDGFIPLHLALRALGAELTIICEVGRLGVKYPKLYKRRLQLSQGYYVEEAIAVARDLHAIDPFDGIVNSHEKNQDITAAIAEALQLPYHTSQTIACIYNKDAMRQRLEQAGLPELAHQMVENISALEAFARAYDYPFVVKPVAGWGSQGVKVINNEGELADYQADLCFPVYVEEYIQGTEYSVETFSENGEHALLGITKKIKLADTCIEIGHAFPADLPGTLRDKIFDYVQRVLTGVGLRFGPAHTEVIVRPDHSLQVIETHNRFGGDKIDELMKYALGVDPLMLWARQVLGEQVLSEVKKLRPQREAAVWFLHTREAGRLATLPPITLMKEANVLDIHYFKAVGDAVEAITDSFSRLGYVVVQGQSQEEALLLAQRVAQRIEEGWRVE